MTQPGDSFTYYEARRHIESDRGTVLMVPMRTTLDEESAFQTCRGWGKFGSPDGEVLRVTVTAHKNGEVSTERIRVYGDILDEGVRVGSGWLDGRHASTFVA